MKNEIGIIREIDRNGRMVIPIEIRKRLCLEDEVEIIITEDGVLIRNPVYDLVKVERGNKK